MNLLSNNRLILNGHRIFNLFDLFLFFTKKFKCEVKSENDIEKILQNYEKLNIAIWHSDTFLKDETTDSYDKIIKLLEKYGTVKQTGKNKKYKFTLYF